MVIHPYCVVGGFLLTEINNITVRLGDTLVLLGAFFWAFHIVFISKSTKFTQLLQLNLSGNRITDLGASALANSKYFKQLKQLNLNFNSIGDLGASSIAESPYLTNLEYLKFGKIFFVTLLTLSSVHWADKIVATNN